MSRIIHCRIGARTVYQQSSAKSKASNFNFNPFPSTPTCTSHSPRTAPLPRRRQWWHPSPALRSRCNYAMRNKNTSTENVSGTARITFQGCCVRSKGSACSREPLTRALPLFPPPSSSPFDGGGDDDDSGCPRWKLRYRHTWSNAFSSGYLRSDIFISSYINVVASNDVCLPFTCEKW